SDTKRSSTRNVGVGAFVTLRNCSHDRRRGGSRRESRRAAEEATEARGSLAIRMQTPRTRMAEVLAWTPPRAAVRVKGWLRTVRDSKQVVFLELNDGSSMASLQAVVDPSIANIEDIRHLTTGSAVAVKGELIASPAKGQTVELRANEVEIIG